MTHRGGSPPAGHGAVHRGWTRPVACHVSSVVFFCSFSCSGKTHWLVSIFSVQSWLMQPSSTGASHTDRGVQASQNKNKRLHHHHHHRPRKVCVVNCFPLCDQSRRSPAGDRRINQQTVRMALATALHHSSGKVHAEYGAPRSQKLATRAGKEVHEEEHSAPR